MCSLGRRVLSVHVRPSKMTLNEHLDEWLPPVVRDRAEATGRNYEDALRPARERLGHKPLQAITKADVERLVVWMLTSGRKRGGKARPQRHPTGQAPKHEQRDKSTWSQSRCAGHRISRRRQDNQAVVRCSDEWW